MKLRIRGSSIRLRLSRGEVARLAATGRVDDAIAFGPARQITYSLLAAHVAAPSASFDGSAIVVPIPRERARTWTASDEVGIEAGHDVGGGTMLSILIEKDFACLVPREGEDDGDAFPNPRGSGSRRALLTRRTGSMVRPHPAVGRADRRAPQAQSRWRSEDRPLHACGWGTVADASPTRTARAGVSDYLVATRARCRMSRTYEGIRRDPDDALEVASVVRTCGARRERRGCCARYVATTPSMTSATIDAAVETRRPGCRRSRALAQLAGSHACAVHTPRLETVKL